MKNIWHPGESPETNGVPQLKPLRAVLSAVQALHFWPTIFGCIWVLAAIGGGKI